MNIYTALTFEEKGHRLLKKDGGVFLKGGGALEKMVLEICSDNSFYLHLRKIKSQLKWESGLNNKT